ncbi:MAG: hypothetical protein IJR29_08465 [Butyrivibrio sp.]|nr:hypothetical protein [Butyrivibrio sp.]
MKTVALIPIKMESKRIPHKNIKSFYDGTPLMSLIRQACLDSCVIDETYIYCSDDTVIPYLFPSVKFLKGPKYLDGEILNMT